MLSCCAVFNKGLANHVLAASQNTHANCNILREGLYNRSVISHQLHEIAELAKTNNCLLNELNRYRLPIIFQPNSPESPLHPNPP